MLTDTETEDQLSEVERIEGIKFVGKAKWYYVKWKGRDDMW